jgi:hypothetical protein
MDLKLNIDEGPGLLGSTPMTAEMAVPDFDVPNIPDDYLSRVKAMKRLNDNLRTFAVQLRKDRVRESKPGQRLRDARGYLAWLSGGIQMSPQLRKDTFIETILRIVLNPEFKFPSDLVLQAQDLLDKWQEENWGQGFVEADEEGTVDIEEHPSSVVPTDSPSSRRVAPAAGQQSPPDVVQLPSPDHPIYGLRGSEYPDSLSSPLFFLGLLSYHSDYTWHPSNIFRKSKPTLTSLAVMHGVLMKRGNRISYCRDTRYPARSARVFGHNGIEIGTWWPRQLVALFNGAHGAMIGGISGNEQHGAYVS